MLGTLLGYARGVGIDADWLVIAGDPEFFAITKRIHNGLYGSPGDGGPLGATEREHYERTNAENVARVSGAVRSGDVVIVHDPQPAGLMAPLREPRRPRRLAVPRRLRRLERVDEARMGVHPPLCRGRRRARLLARGVRPELDRSRPVAGDPALDRPVRAEEPRPDPVRGARAAGRGGARRGGRRPSRRARAEPCARRPRRAARGSADSPRGPGLALGPDQGHGWRARGVRSPRHRAGRAAGARRPCGERRRGRSGRRAALGGDGRPVAGAAARRPGARRPRHRPDGRPGRERARDQRAPAARHGRRPEEPRRGVRSHRRGGDVEEPPGGRERGRRDRRSDRRRGDGAPRPGPARPRELRRRGRAAAARPDRGQTAWAATRGATSSATSSATATCSSTRR